MVQDNGPVSTPTASLEVPVGEVLPVEAITTPAAPTAPFRPHLDNSRPLIWTCCANDDAAVQAIGHLLGLMDQDGQRKRARRADDAARIRFTMEAVVLDLYRAAVADSTLYLAYSRRKAEYGPTGECPQASLTSVTQVIDFLAGAGLVETVGGSYSRKPNPFGGPDTGTGYRSRMRATPFLVEMLEGVFGVSVQSLAAGTTAVGRPIRMRPPVIRGVKTPYIRFDRSAETDAMADRVMAANRLRSTHLLSFEGPVPNRVQLDSIDMHRLFNDGRWDRGGRFYGAWWVGVRAKDRARILIDGEETVELDFAASQPRLAFHLEGHPLGPEDDPYMLAGHPRKLREAAKIGFGQLVASDPDMRPIRRPEHKHLFPTASGYTAFLAELETAWSAIGPWLRSGRSLELQFIESGITDSIIAALTEQGIPCLPIHDSFIVPRSAEVTLGRLMREVYGDRLAQRTNVVAHPLIKGWSSPEIEQVAMNDQTPPSPSQALIGVD